MKNLKSKPAYNRKDYTGVKTEYLTAISFVRMLNHRSMWLFECICGRQKVISAYRVANGIIKSCGCIKNRRKEKSFYKRMFHIYKRGAKNREHQFSLTLNDFINLVKQNCFYCDTTPKENATYTYLINEHTEYVNGIDRKDNSLGYTLSNTVSCCKICNSMKMKLDYKTFIERCKLIASKYDKGGGK